MNLNDVLFNLTYTTYFSVINFLKDIEVFYIFSI